AMSDLLTAPYRRGAETLLVPLDADTVSGGLTTTAVKDYDFREYRARHGADPPEPRYVLFLKKPTGRDVLDVQVDVTGRPTGQRVAPGRIPPESYPGASFAVPVPAVPSLRLLTLRQRPVALAGTGADNFGILALLGNLAKLAWVLGGEKDQL